MCGHSAQQLSITIRQRALGFLILTKQATRADCLIKPAFCGQQYTPRNTLGPRGKSAQVWPSVACMRAVYPSNTLASSKTAPGYERTSVGAMNRVKRLRRLARALEKT